MVTVTCTHSATPLRKSHARVLSRERAILRSNEVRLRKRLRMFFKQAAKRLSQYALSHYGDAYKGLPVDHEIRRALVAEVQREDWTDIDEAAGEMIAAVMINSARGNAKMLKQDAYIEDAAALALNAARAYMGGTLIKANTRKWNDLKKVTRDAIENEVGAAIEDGLTVAELAEAIRDSAGFSEQRAQTIARTEMARADSQGALAAYRAVPSITGKSWLVDEDPCEICLENEAEGAIPLDQDFSSGDDAAPAHPNCECAIVPAFDDEMDS